MTHAKAGAGSGVSALTVTQLLVMCVAALLPLGCNSARPPGTSRQSGPVATKASALPGSHHPANTVRDLLDALYAGSVDSVKDQFHPDYLRYMTDSYTAGVSEVLHKRFGRVSRIEFESSAPPTGTPYNRGVEEVWRATADKGSFDMKIWFNGEGTIGGLWLRYSPNDQWLDVPLIGQSVVLEKRRKGVRTGQQEAGN